jgi:hypothetical protein
MPQSIAIFLHPRHSPADLAAACASGREMQLDEDEPRYVIDLGEPKGYVALSVMDIDGEDSIYFSTEELRSVEEMLGARPVGIDVEFRSSAVAGEMLAGALGGFDCVVADGLGPMQGRDEFLERLRTKRHQWLFEGARYPGPEDVRRPYHERYGDDK